MSKYTTEVRFICESLAGYIEQQGYGNVEDILTKAAPLVFDFDFPIFDEDYRLPLERKILRHFYTREISEETVGLWKLKLDAKMNEIMPYYNQLYNSELIEFNPMYDTDLTTKSSTDGTKDSVGTSKSETDTTKNELEKTNYGEITTEDKTGSSKTVTDETGTTKVAESGSTTKKEVTDDDIGSTTTESATSTTTGNSLDAYSDTPQGSLTGVKDLSYLTNARNVDDTSTTTSSGTTKYTGTDDKTVTTTGSDSNDKTTTSDVDGTKNVNTTEDTDGTKKYNKDVNTDTTSNSVTNGSTTGNITSTQDYVQYITGKRSLSSFSKYLLEFRETFLNIDNMILEELNGLFFNLW